MNARRGGRRPKLLIVQHDVGAPPGLLAVAAEKAGVELDVRVTSLGARVPADLDGHAGLVVLGGTAGVEDAPEQPHLYEELELIRTVTERGDPFLGICLGGQLAAEALGGRVGRGKAGVEVGWVEVSPTEAGRIDPVASSVAEGTLLFQWHRDVFEPPPGAIPLLVGGRYGTQGFRLRNAWAVQSHPEIDPPTIAMWADTSGGQADLDEAGVSREEILDGAEHKTNGGRSLLDAWCRWVVARLGERR